MVEHLAYSDVTKCKKYKLPFILCFTNGHNLTNKLIVQICNNLCREHPTVKCYSTDWYDYKAKNLCPDKQCYEVARFDGKIRGQKAHGLNKEDVKNIFLQIETDISTKKVFKQSAGLSKAHDARKRAGRTYKPRKGSKTVKKKTDDKIDETKIQPEMNIQKFTAIHPKQALQQVPIILQNENFFILNKIPKIPCVRLQSSNFLHPASKLIKPTIIPRNPNISSQPKDKSDSNIQRDQTYNTNFKSKSGTASAEESKSAVELDIPLNNTELYTGNSFTATISSNEKNVSNKEHKKSDKNEKVSSLKNTHQKEITVKQSSFESESCSKLDRQTIITKSNKQKSPEHIIPKSITQIEEFNVKLPKTVKTTTSHRYGLRSKKKKSEKNSQATSQISPKQKKPCTEKKKRSNSQITNFNEKSEFCSQYSNNSKRKCVSNLNLGLNCKNKYKPYPIRRDTSQKTFNIPDRPSRTELISQIMSHVSRPPVFVTNKNQYINNITVVPRNIDIKDSSSDDEDLQYQKI